MHSDDEIKAEAYRRLTSLSEGELENIAELSMEIKIPAASGRMHRYTVFFERAVGVDMTMEKEKREWQVRNIIRPDNLEDPQPKQNKIE